MLVSKNADVTAIMVNKVEGTSRNMGFLIKPMVRGDAMTMLEVHFAGGASSQTHSHTHESMIYIVRGRIKTTIGEESYLLGPGDSCRHPADMPHSVMAIEDTIFVEIKSPPPDMASVLGI